VSDDECLCGLKNSTAPESKSTFVDVVCPVETMCGCCPTLYVNCLARNLSADFCADLLCEVQEDCNGRCSGDPIYYDDCGVMCGDNNCESQNINGSIPICLVIDLCGVCGGNGQSCAGCDGIPNSGLEWGVNCETGERVCNGTKEDKCPLPLTVTAKATAVGGAVGGAVIAMTAVGCAVIMGGIARRTHFQQQISASYDEAIVEQLSCMTSNPFYQNNGLEFQVDLDEYADFDDLGDIAG